VKTQIVALLSVHNRCETTLKSLGNLFQQEGNGTLFNISAVVVDDGSTDGTGAAITNKFPQVNVVRGDGSLFWCRGMCRAYEQSADLDANFYLLLNDDTFVYPDAIKRVLAAYKEKHAGQGVDHIIVGSTRDPMTKVITYGGSKRVSNWHPFRYRLVEPKDISQPCDTFNGNFVLIPRTVIEKIGFLDNHYSHRFGDTDYGLTASKAACKLWVAPGVIGECSKNNPKINWDSAALPFTDRVKMLDNVKGMPVRESRRFYKKHGGVLWPLFWVMPMIRGLFFPTRYS